MIRGSVVRLAPSGLPQVSSTLDSHPIRVLLPVLRGGQAAVARAVLDGTQGPDLALRVQAVSSQAERGRQMERLVTMLTVAEATRADPVRYPAVLPVLESFVLALPGDQVPVAHPDARYELWCDVMPWCRTSLAHARDEVLASGPSAAVARLLPLVLTVQAVHEHLNVVHRDITPNNVLVDPSGRLLLADWGIAHTVAPGQTSTRTELVGNRGFSLPPEMLAGDQTVGRYTDAWYLGSLLVWLFTGQPRYSPGVLPGGRAGAELDDVARGLCAPDPRQRTPLAEAAYRLDRLRLAGPSDWEPARLSRPQDSPTASLTGAPAGAPEPTPQAVRPRRRLWWTVGVAAGLVVVAVAAVAAWRLTHRDDAHGAVETSTAPSCWDDLGAGRCPAIDSGELMGTFPVRPEVRPPECSEYDVDYEADPGPTSSWLLECEWPQETGDESRAVYLQWYRDSAAVAEHFRAHDMPEGAADAPPFSDGPDGPVYSRTVGPGIDVAYCYAELPVCLETSGDPEVIAKTLDRFTSLTSREAHRLLVSYTRGSAGDTQEPATPDADVTQWVDDYVAAAGQVTTAHVVVDQTIVTGGDTATTHLDVDLAGNDRSFTGDGLGYSFAAVIVGDTAYLQSDDGWEDMPRSQLSVQEIHMNPAATIALQRVALTDVELVGSEEVDGVQTDHYVVTYDAAKRTDLPLGSSYSATVMGDTITADVWLDAQKRPVRYRSTILVRQDMASGRIVQEAVYSDYGKPVTIEAPQC